MAMGFDFYGLPACLPARGNNVRSLFAQPTTHHHQRRQRIVNLLHREMEFHPWQPRLIRLGMSVPESGYGIVAMEHIQRDGHYSPIPNTDSGTEQSLGLRLLLLLFSFTGISRKLKSYYYRDSSRILMGSWSAQSPSHPIHGKRRSSIDWRRAAVAAIHYHIPQPSFHLLLSMMNVIGQ